MVSANKKEILAHLIAKVGICNRKNILRSDLSRSYS